MGGKEKEGGKGGKEGSWKKNKNKKMKIICFTLICQQSHSGSTIPSITVTVLGRDNFPSTVVLTRCSTLHTNSQLKRPLCIRPSDNAIYRHTVKINHWKMYM